MNRDTISFTPSQEIDRNLLFDAGYACELGVQKRGKSEETGLRNISVGCRSQSRVNSRRCSSLFTLLASLLSKPLLEAGGEHVFKSKYVPHAFTLSFQRPAPILEAVE